MMVSIVVPVQMTMTQIFGDISANTADMRGKRMPTTNAVIIRARRICNHGATKANAEWRGPVAVVKQAAQRACLFAVQFVPVLMVRVSRPSVHDQKRRSAP